MNNKSAVKIAFWWMIIGMTLGSLMAITIKYPVKAASIAEVEKMCAGENLGVQVFKVGISGKVYLIKCKSQKVFEFK